MEDKREIYRKADLGGRVGFGKRPALLVVDFQKSFCTPDYIGGADFSEAVENTAVLLNSCRRHQVPVIYTVVAYLDPQREAGRLSDSDRRSGRRIHSRARAAQHASGPSAFPCL